MTPSRHRRIPALWGRTDSTWPPGTPRSPDHTPYPSAPARATTNRPGTRRASTSPRPRATTTTPIPVTVWACGPTPIDPNSVWPAPIVKKIVTSFSKPGGRVVMLPWPTSPAAAHTVIDHTSAPEPDTELAIALTAITDLDRSVHVAHVEPTPPTYNPASQPFRADLIRDPDNTSAPQPGSLHHHPPHAAPHRLDLKAGGTDVIITSLRPEHSETRVNDHLCDHVALLAARLLRLRGILVVLTHSDWSHGELLDPTGPIVASAQHAGLLYLQHIIALHTPIHGGQFLWHPSPAATDKTHSPHHAQPHHRISSDLLVFTQPRDHQPPPLTPTATMVATAVIR
jgi:hypothetical protein